MNFQFKATTDGPCDSTNQENEYRLELKFTSLKLNDKELKKVQLLFLYGDLLSKKDLDVPEDEEGTLKCDPQVYIIHSTPNALALKFQSVPIIFLLLDDAKKIIGAPVILEVNECFANTVRCNDFKQQSLKKNCELEQGGGSVGSISFTFQVIKEIGNSNKYRKFYTESTAEKAKIIEKLASDHVK